METYRKLNIRNWATDLDEKALIQASKAARLPILAGPIALMPDAHLGYGVPIGSVIATREAIIPSAVGVDVGCGMHAECLVMDRAEIEPKLGAILATLDSVIPAGMGKNHEVTTGFATKWLTENQMPDRWDDRQKRKAADQLGTLGSGNHFVEISVDENNQVWVVLHSGSRGIGNDIARTHIQNATKDFATVVEGYELDDPQLAWLVQGTPAFAEYWKDLQWLQRYAHANRQAMFLAVLTVISGALNRPVWTSDSVSCHHNYSTVEHHHGADVYVTRKGAILASEGARGIIPGSMGTSTFLTAVATTCFTLIWLLTSRRLRPSSSRASPSSTRHTNAFSPTDIQLLSCQTCTTSTS